MRILIAPMAVLSETKDLSLGPMLWLLKQKKKDMKLPSVLLRISIIVQ